MRLHVGLSLQFWAAAVATVCITKSTRVEILNSMKHICIMTDKKKMMCSSGNIKHIRLDELEDGKIPNSESKFISFEGARNRAKT